MAGGNTGFAPSPPQLPQMRFEMSAGILFDGDTSRVARVMRWSSADLFQSLRPGDVIVSINASDGSSLDNVSKIRNCCNPGVVNFLEAGLSMTVLSEEQRVREVSLVLSPTRQLQIKDQLWKLHQVLQSVHHEKVGSTGLILNRCEDTFYRVGRIVENSPASLCACLHKNDIIQSIDGHFISGKSKSEVDVLERGKPGTLCNYSVRSGLDANVTTVCVPRVRVIDFEVDNILKELADLTEIAERERISFLTNLYWQMRRWKDEYAAWLCQSKQAMELIRTGSKANTRETSLSEEIRIEVSLIQNLKLIKLKHLSSVLCLWSRESHHKAQKRSICRHFELKKHWRDYRHSFHVWSEYTLQALSHSKRCLHKNVRDVVSLIHSHTLLPMKIVRFWQQETFSRVLHQQLRIQTSLKSNVVKFVSVRLTKDKFFCQWKVLVENENNRAKGLLRLARTLRKKLFTACFLHWTKLVNRSCVILQFVNREYKRNQRKVRKELFKCWLQRVRSKKRMLHYAVKLLTRRHEMLLARAFKILKESETSNISNFIRIPSDPGKPAALSRRISNVYCRRLRLQLSRMIIHRFWLCWVHRISYKRKLIYFKERIMRRRFVQIVRKVVVFMRMVVTEKRSQTDAMLYLLHRRVQSQLIRIIYGWKLFENQRRAEKIFAKERGYNPENLKRDTFLVSTAEWQQHLRKLFGFCSWKNKLVVQKFHQSKINMMSWRNEGPITSRVNSTLLKPRDDVTVIET